MKLTITNIDVKFPIKLHLPLITLKIIFNLMMKYSPEKYQFKFNSEYVKVIKKFVKKNGHFVLFESFSEEYFVSIVI